ncbi:BQ2448_6157 [Microbotryum intermedium]|uniref:BQ2448_6157 protein n=1 Tax=Microbotryum intermedium TaxID=269621 RepID=A0A238FKE1_9BASI|nr:BQ2448_6157 [Microbotryum intermedium]
MAEIVRSLNIMSSCKVEAAVDGGPLKIIVFGSAGDSGGERGRYAGGAFDSSTRLSGSDTGSRTEGNAPTAHGLGAAGVGLTLRFLGARTLPSREERSKVSVHCSLLSSNGSYTMDVPGWHNGSGTFAARWRFDTNGFRINREVPVADGRCEGEDEGGSEHVELFKDMLMSVSKAQG